MPTEVVYRPDGAATVHLRTCRFIVNTPEGTVPRSFDQGVITVGASVSNDLVIRDETVSRHHCVVEREASGYVVRDLGSTNGTFIDGVRIREAYLEANSVLGLGNTRVAFQTHEKALAVHPSEEARFEGVVGDDVKMRRLFNILERIAPTDSTVVIEGETGTGKEVVAHALHARSHRRDRPFMVFDCSAVPPNLMETELFGHERGSFTGAIMARPGLFELADGGTLFLDEIGELSLDLQPKLLRALESREVRRVGATRPTRVDVRVLAATNRNLELEMKAGRFREDLFFRLSVVRLFLPPLRERLADIPLLVEHFLAEGRFNRGPRDRPRVDQVAADVLETLGAHHWPGNVRELHNVVERACSFTDGRTLRRDALPPYLGQSAHQARLDRVHPVQIALADGFKAGKEQWIAAFERDYIARVLAEHDHNISRAARAAGIDRKHLRKLINKHGLSSKPRALSTEP